MALATRARPALDQRALVLGALRGERPLAAVAAESGVGVAALRRWLLGYLRGKLPSTSGTVPSPVGRPVEIMRDRWGIPHIFAETVDDLDFGFGFAVAQDRLWQLDYRRRAAYGTLAEVLGPSALAGDLTARTLDFASVAAAEMASHPESTRRALVAYAAGINHALAALGDKLPAEFDVLEYRPEPWRPLDSVTIARASLWQFSGRIENIVIAEAATRLPARLAERFLSVEAPDESIVPGEPSPPHPPLPTLGEGEGNKCASLGEGFSPQGSNQWAVGPSLAARGAPLLASDGHVPFTQPSSRYEVHLCGGGIDLIGITDPGVPLLGNARNRHVAWGSTNNVSSIRDLYVEELDPNNPDQVRDGDRFVPLAARTEEIRIRGEAPVVKVIRSSPRGPIVNELIPSVEPDGDPPLALRWVGLEPHDSITAGLELAEARTADEARRIHRGWQLSGQNPGFADVEGHIGYQMRGRVPRRGRVTRGYRVASDPADQWGEPLPFEVLPAMADPPRGWIGSANQRPHPPSSSLPLYGAYGDGYRGRRMRTLIESGSGYVLADMGRFQNDVYSERAAELKDRLAELLVYDEKNTRADGTVSTLSTVARGPSILARAARLLRRWDCRFTLDSVAASIFAVFWWRWTERVAAARFPEHLTNAAAGAAGAVAHDLLLEGDFGWFPSPPAPLPQEERGVGANSVRPPLPLNGGGVGERVATEARAAMAEALAWLDERLGSDWRRWTWGRLHPLTLSHPLSAGCPVFAELFDIGPRPCPGSQGVLNQNGFRVGDRFAAVSGPHYRFLCDLAEPGLAEGTNTAGNSGSPASPHYADQLADWLVGRYHQLWMDRATIEANAEGRLRLEPPTRKKSEE